MKNSSTKFQKRIADFLLLIALGGIFLCFFFLANVMAQQLRNEEKTASGLLSTKKEGEPLSPNAVEVNGNSVEYDVKTNSIFATGNVVIKKGKVTLTCDRVVFHRETHLAEAEGNVVLRSPNGKISGRRLKFDFNTMTGDFEGAKIYANPYYGKAPVISKVGKDHIEMKDGVYITTSDFDKPEYRLVSRKVDIYPGKKAVARNVLLYVGKIPVMYIPKYTQILTDKKPRVIFTPGYDKDWGAFLLSQWRYYFSENFKGVIHADYRTSKDIAWGVDLNYRIPKGGSGIVRTYYMNERNITSDWPWQKKPSPTIERERFKVEWRHKWQIDDKTEAIMQYYKLSDAGFLKDYFENEYDEDSNPDSYFLFTRNLAAGTFSFLTDFRVNRFVSKVERLPEIQYTLSNQRLGATRFYLKSVSTYSNLTSKTASPSEVRQKTMRLDLDNEISYPFKIGFIEARPFVGGENTYYSRTKPGVKNSLVRGQFKTGIDLSTKFYKVFDVETNLWGLDIHQLRHIITPSISYVFKSNPTVSNAQIDQIDSTDDRTEVHTITFGLDNKLQTKREGKSVDLLRFTLSSDFALKEDEGSGGFRTVSSDIEFKPTDWLTVYSDAEFDSQAEHLTSANMDIYITQKDKWSFSLSKRYTWDMDDEITAGLDYTINPKWLLRAYERFDIDTGLQKEFEVSFVRDLHSWQMELSFNETRGEGSEIWLVFTLKAFPDIALDFGTSFHKRKAGTAQ